MDRGPTLDIEQNRQTAPERSAEVSPRHDARDRTHSLRRSEIRAMSDIGTFRIVDRADLRKFAYQGNDAQMVQDIQSLRSRGLVEERTIYRAHRMPRQILTLTEKGQLALRRSGQVADGQQLHSGFLKPRDVDHDADLYPVYQKAAEEIQRRGGKLTRVRLDFELKSAVTRDRDMARKLPERQRKAWLKTATEQRGLSMQGGVIQLPDIQIEYETVDGTLAQENLEFVSENYRPDAIRSKAGAGFKVYARNRDSARVQRALQASGAVEEILSI